MWVTVGGKKLAPGFSGTAWKVKLKVKVNFTLEQATKDQRGSRGIAHPFFNLGGMWDGWSTPRPGRFTRG